MTEYEKAVADIKDSLETTKPVTGQAVEYKKHKKKSHMVWAPGLLHDACKAVAHECSIPCSLSTLSQLGMLLVLLERGVIKGVDCAMTMRVDPKAVVLFDRILKGELW